MKPGSGILLLCQVGYFCKRLKFCKAFSHVVSLWSAPKTLEIRRAWNTNPIFQTREWRLKSSNSLPRFTESRELGSIATPDFFLGYQAGTDRKREGGVPAPSDKSSSAPSLLYRCQGPWNVLCPLHPSAASQNPHLQMASWGERLQLLRCQPPNSTFPFSISRGPLQ